MHRERSGKATYRGARSRPRRTLTLELEKLIFKEGARLSKAQGLKPADLRQAVEPRDRIEDPKARRGGAYAQD